MNKKGNEKFILWVVAILVLYVAILHAIYEFRIFAINPLPTVVYVVVYTVAIFGLVLSLLAIEDNLLIKGIRLILIISLIYFYILPYLDNLDQNWALRVIIFPAAAIYAALFSGIMLLIDAIRIEPSE